MNKFFIHLKTYVNFEQRVTVEYGLGSVTINSAKKVNVHELAVFSIDGTKISMSNAATSSEPVKLILIAGQPLNEPVVQHGPFVLTNEEDLMKTFDDYQKGKNGFEKAPGWKSKQGTEALKARGKQGRDL